MLITVKTPTQLSPHPVLVSQAFLPGVAPPQVFVFLAGVAPPLLLAYGFGVLELTFHAGVFPPSAYGFGVREDTFHAGVCALLA